LGLGAGPGGGEQLGQSAATELVAQDAEGAGTVAELVGGVFGGTLIDEVGAQGFVLALPWAGGHKEEAAAFR
jgi:hypothetical protein